MSRMSYIVAILSLIISLLFASICLLLHPLWGDINNFLSTNFPVMLSAAILGGVCFAGSLFLLETRSFGQRWHYVVFLLLDLIMTGLLAYLLYQLGTERTVLVRQTLAALPYILWFGAILLYLWFMPRSATLQSRPMVIGFIVLLAGSALLWRNLPFSLKLTSSPAVFLREGGVVVAWGTNMTATGEVIYSLDGKPQDATTSQTHGLKDLGDQVVRVFIPFPSLPESLSLTVSSEGVKNIYPTRVNKTDKISSEPVELPFPTMGEPLSFVSFSDLHEQSNVYEQLSAHLPWEEMDLAVYNGDLLNSTVGPVQVARSILGLPTGDRNLPRIFVRGNHETRNEAARLLDEWLLPQNGRWYQAFTLGNTFFIVLDGGEDKPDADQEYGGLVDFSSYHREQAQWLENVLASPEFKAARYQVVLLHVPLFGEDQAPPSFEPVASLLRSNRDIDLMINGHTHEYGIFKPEESGLPYPAAFSGGPETDTAAAVIVNTNEDALRVRIMDIHGNIVEQIP
jgi:predicted phosphodiesterase